ncbi:RNA polymerase sigma factor [Mucilaginibacter sp. UR6-11]|uniref:RNA polymerase sigma factor n=1 Tax=Mucilaginibacter sp. UR6-11 TaxID=1435644 RepID=UPI001E448923|nr:sigma-70 family RNA polymerase sigma factor [Mucilaginibacter sp. UR6-11]MCC8423696.1 sigma-70 family RNA polymerase sigma factor [Mucilaginibacter sp. UR6-11]
MERFSDLELLEQIKNNDHVAFDVMFGRYWKKLYQTAQARIKDEDTAKDIVQEIFIKIWNRRDTLKINTSLENYLQSAVRLSVISHYRSKKVTELQLNNALERINLLEDSIHSLSDYFELERTLQQAIDGMPEMLKKVYELRSENHSVKAIAGELGLADQTVKNYIAEVSRRLRIVISHKYPEKHLTYMAIIIAILHK